MPFVPINVKSQEIFNENQDLRSIEVVKAKNLEEYPVARKNYFENHPLTGWILFGIALLVIIVWIIVCLCMFLSCPVSCSLLICSSCCEAICECCCC